MFFEFRRCAAIFNFNTKNRGLQRSDERYKVSEDDSH